MIEFFLALGLLIGSHEAGHQIEADRLDIPIAWHGRTSTYSGTPEEVELITNSGFVKQDAVGSALGSPLYWKTNGAYKLTYLLRNEGDMLNISASDKFFIGVSGALNFAGHDVRLAQLTKNTTGIIKTWRFK